ncbi:hypothetical protein ABBQ38_013006 [Trebouxia sp. C0009 RCD-2024]
MGRVLEAYGATSCFPGTHYTLGGGGAARSGCKPKPVKQGDTPQGGALIGVADIKQKGSLCTRVLVDLEDPWQLQAEQLVSCEPCPSIVCYLCGCVPTL